MRRVVGVFLILMFWLGPLASLLPANEESRLPACCRRHGTHHCAMAARMAMLQARPDSAPSFRAPDTCPEYPGSQAAATASVHAVTASAAGAPVLRSQPHSAWESRFFVCKNTPLARANRGPPTSQIS
jgi:hypothetical protein